MIYSIILFLCAQGKLLSVVEVCRHGARAPIDNYSWDTNLWPEGFGELTDAGARQQFLNGAEFRKRYIDTGFMSPFYNVSEFYVRSTDVNRTIMTAQAQIMGFYSEGPVLTSAATAQVAVPPFAGANFSQQVASLGLAAVPINFQPVPVHVVSSNYDLMLVGYNPAACPYIGYILSSVQSSTPYFNRVFEYQQGLQVQIASVFGVQVDYINAGYMADALTCDLFNQYPIPSGVTPSMYNQMAGIQNYSNSMFFEMGGAQLAGSEFFSALINNYNSVINKTSELKFSLYSAHDTTLTGFLMALNIYNGYNPPFASSILFELYEDDADTLRVNVTYNDELMQLPNCTDISCEYQEFQSFLLSWIVDDVQAACQYPEGFDASGLGEDILKIRMT